MTKARRYVNAILEGCSKQEALRRAGYVNRPPGAVLERAMKASNVRSLLASDPTLPDELDGVRKTLTDKRDALDEQLASTEAMIRAIQDVLKWRESRKGDADSE